MSKKLKLLQKLTKRPPPKDFRWDDLVTLMRQYDFKEDCEGGSHYMFEHDSGYCFSVSKTHPSGILKEYQIKNIKKALVHMGLEIGSNDE